jgi:tetratricopeptide (TPR) repeat protein
MTAALWEDARKEYLLVLQELPPEARVPALVDLAVLNHWLLDVPATHRYANEALERATEMGRDDLAAAAEVALALASSSDGDLDESVDRYRRAYERNNRKHILLPSAGVELQGLVLYWRGDIDAAVSLSRDTIEMGRASYDTTSVVRSLGNLGMSLVGKGQYAEAEQVFLEARAFARDRNLATWLARATAMHAGLHLQLFDFDAAEALSEEARDISSAANWRHATISGGIDLLLNYTRRGDGGRAAELVDEVAEGVAAGQGAHGWLWRLRFAQAQAELALLAEDWDAALQWAETAWQRSRRHGRIKYEILALQACARALVGVGRTQAAIRQLTNAANRARESGDPLLFLQAASDLLALDGSDALLQDAGAALTVIVEAIPSEEMRGKVQASTSARIVTSLTPSSFRTAWSAGHGRQEQLSPEGRRTP